MSPIKPIRILRIIARLNIGGAAVQAILLSEYFSGGTYQTLLVCGKVGCCAGDMSYLARSKGVRPLVLRGLGKDFRLQGLQASSGPREGHQAIQATHHSYPHGQGGDPRAACRHEF